MADDLEQSIAEINALMHTLSVSGSPESLLKHVEVAEPEPEDDNPYCIKNGAYVRISEDKMCAWIYLNPPKDGEDFYSRDLIVEFINQNGVTHGLHNSNISAIAKKHIYEREVVIANGALPVEGRVGYYEFFFDTSDKRKPQVREDGTVDYTSMSQLTNVNEGDLLAVYHPAEQGTPGYDVLGKENALKPYKDLPALKGRGFSNEGNPNEYVATVSGRVDYNDGRIDIKDVYEVKGDLDLIVGHVEFFGDIHIMGNVESGVVIRASRNITVDGVVAGASLFAGGDIVLARGAKGAQKGKLSARGNISAEFLEHVEVEAGGDVRSNAYVNATVDAGGMVIAEGNKGIILGGKIRGQKGVSATCIGNEMETKTIVQCGYTAEEYSAYSEILTRENKARTELADIVEKMTKILKDRRLGQDKFGSGTDAEIQKLNSRKDALFAEIDDIVSEKERLANIISTGKGGMILANEKIYRGVSLSIEGALLEIPANTTYTRYKYEGGRVATSVIVVN